MLEGFQDSPGTNLPRVKCWTLCNVLWALQLRGYEQALCWELVSWLRVVQRLTGGDGCR
jgi:hypothetical protein